MWRDIYLTAQVLELPARGSRLPTQSYSPYSRPRPPLQDLGADWEVSPFNRALEYVANCSSLSCWNVRAWAWGGSSSCLSLLTFYHEAGT